METTFSLAFFVLFAPQGPKPCPNIDQTSLELYSKDSHFDNGRLDRRKIMGNCCKRGEPFNPGAVLDRVVANAEPACLLYNLANFKKGGQLVETFNKGGSKGVKFEAVFHVIALPYASAFLCFSFIAFHLPFAIPFCNRLPFTPATLGLPLPLRS